MQFNDHRCAIGVSMTALLFVFVFLPLEARAEGDAAAVRKISSSATQLLSQAAGRKDAGERKEAFLRLERQLEEGWRAALELEGDVGGKWQAHLATLWGVSLQKKAEGLAAEPEVQKEVYAQSVSWFKRAVQAQPTSASARGNLAKAYSRVGVAPAQTYQQAIEIAAKHDPKRQYLFMQNYADYLAENGDPKRALAYYTRAARQRAEDVVLHEKIVKLYLASDPAGLGTYLWELVRRGKVLRAQGTAFAALEASQAWPEDAATELLTVIVVAQSRQAYHPRSFEKLDVAQRLRKLGEIRPALSRGIKEVFELHRGGGKPTDYRWWRQRTEPMRDPKRGVWPQDGFRDLTNSLGDWYKDQARKENPIRQRRYNEAAESFYRIGLKLDPEQVSPTSLLRLADMRIVAGDADGLRRVVAQNEVDLLHGKMKAYRLSRMDKIFEYHQALGTVYYHLGPEYYQCKDGSVACAEFQLSRAVDVGHMYTEKADRDRTVKPITIQPTLVNNLASVYRKTGQKERAQSTQLDMTRFYLQRDDKQAAGRVLANFERAVPKTSLKGITKSTWETLKGQLGPAYRDNEFFPKEHVPALPERTPPKPPKAEGPTRRPSDPVNAPVDPKDLGSGGKLEPTSKPVRTFRLVKTGEQIELFAPTNPKGAPSKDGYTFLGNYLGELLAKTRAHRQKGKTQVLPEPGKGAPLQVGRIVFDGRGGKLFLSGRPASSAVPFKLRLEKGRPASFEFVRKR